MKRASTGKAKVPLAALPAQPNQSLLDGLACLEAALAAETSVPGRQLARELGLNRTRVNRLLMTLAHAGLLERSRRGRYGPGPALPVLAALGIRRSGLLHAALPVARRWWAAGYAVTLGILWREHLCHLLHARPEAPFDDIVASRPVTHPLESAAGLALVSSGSDQLVERVAISCTRWVPAQARKLVKQCRATGYARLDFSGGVVALGLVVGRPPLAALSVSRVLGGEAELMPLLEQLRADVAALAL